MRQVFLRVAGAEMTKRDKLEKAAKASGIEFTTIIWEPLTRGPEMCGPEGGWIISGKRGPFDSIGYNFDAALDWIKRNARS